MAKDNDTAIIVIAEKLKDIADGVRRLEFVREEIRKELNNGDRTRLRSITRQNW